MTSETKRAQTEPAKPTQKPEGLIAKLLGHFKRIRAQRIEIRLCPLEGPTGPQQQPKLLAALQKRKNLQAKIGSKPFEPQPVLETEVAINSELAASKAWAADPSVDLVVVGEVPEPGLAFHLRFLPQFPPDADEVQIFSPATVLAVPVELTPELNEAVVAVALAAVQPTDQAKKTGLYPQLAISLEAALPFLSAPPAELTGYEQAAMQIALANAALVLASNGGTPDLYQMAADGYGNALGNLKQRDYPVEWALAHKNLGLAMQALSERDDDPKTLEAAAEAYRRALTGLGKNTLPHLWADTQNRLGLALYRLDSLSGDTELLKHAISAFQAALQVHTRQQSPLRWAEVMNNLAQAAQVLGGQLRSVEAVEKAIDACNAALEVRDRKSHPMLWAATQNTLGSAFFLLAKLSHKAVHMQAAGKAFKGAAEAYDAEGANRLAAIAARNLERVEQILTQVKS